MEGQTHTISFTCGTESKMGMVDEPLMAVEDVWVQEGEPAMVKTASVKDTAQLGWSCGDVWLVEERVRALEVNLMETAADAGHVRQQGMPDEHHDCPGWTEDGRNVIEQEGSEEVEVLEAMERASWCGEIRRPYIPVRVFGGAMRRLVRKGEILAQGTRVATQQVCSVDMPDGEYVQEAHGMLQHSLDVPEDDWGHAMNWREVVAAVSETQKEPFKAWMEGEEGNALNIGDGGTQLAEGQKQDCAMLIYAFKDIIAVNPKAPGVIKGMFHRIPFLDGVDTTPWQEYVRVGSPAEEEIKDNKIETMLKNKILEAGCGEWVNDTVMVKKADVTPRCCIDFRRLNDISRRDAFALSRIDGVLDTVGRHKVYSVMDAASAFWSVRPHPDGMDKTAFSSRKWGLLRFTRMPFGLKTATSTYSRALPHVRRGLLRKQAAAYVGDACVCAGR